MRARTLNNEKRKGGLMARVHETQSMQFVTLSADFLQACDTSLCNRVRALCLSSVLGRLQPKWAHNSLLPSHIPIFCAVGNGRGTQLVLVSVAADAL